ncbi:hypothetical protein GLOIN_2v1572576 [Rhizophagus clarus]|uniref:Uncharacterized protein n=1 Tax=Rhizophagus clarus TaxID=94130 RepID=A0A8H3LVQ4_9GLOM|nr:hypothetical protein GLOIN_2v1572576 [Rhizophagus clarus]
MYRFIHKPYFPPSRQLILTFVIKAGVSGKLRYSSATKDTYQLSDDLNKILEECVYKETRPVLKLLREFERKTFLLEVEIRERDHKFEIEKQEREHKIQIEKQKSEIEKQEREHKIQIEKQKNEIEKQEKKCNTEIEKQMRKHETEIEKQKRKHETEIMEKTIEIITNKMNHKFEIADKERNHKLFAINTGYLILEFLNLKGDLHLKGVFEQWESFRLVGLKGDQRTKWSNYLDEHKVVLDIFRNFWPNPDEIDANNVVTEIENFYKWLHERFHNKRTTGFYVVWSQSTLTPVQNKIAEYMCKDLHIGYQNY